MRTTRLIELLTTAAAVVALPFSIAWPGPRAPGVSRPLPDLRYPPLTTGADLARLSHLGDAIAAADCGADLRVAAALVDPSALPDREGEWVRLVNLEPVAIDLRDWRLSLGARRLELPALSVPSGGSLLLGAPGRHPLTPLRLSNRGGELVLIDPCGVPRSRIGWGGLDCPEALPGVPIWGQVPRGFGARGRRESWGTSKRLGPTRSVTGGAVGGCGQT